MDKSPHHNKFPEAAYIGLKMVCVGYVSGTKKLYIEWENGDRAVIDFSGLISENRWFRPLKDDHFFQKAKITTYGRALEWSDDISIGSDTVRVMADRQNTVLGRRMAS